LETEYRLAENELIKERNFISTILDTTDCLIVVLDREGQIVRFNRACEKTTMYTFEEVKGKQFWNIFFNPGNIQSVKIHFQQLLKGDLSNASGENYWLTKNSYTRFIIWSNNVLFDNEGTVKYVICTGIDITERKQAEELFKTLTYSSPIGIYIIQAGNFQFVNPKFQEHKCFSKDELLGRNAMEFVIPEDRERTRKNAIDMLKGLRTNPYEYRTVNKKGETRWIMETVTSIQHQGRRAVLGNHVDITKRKLAEEKLQRLTSLDGLTGIANRRYFDEHFEREWKRAIRCRKPLSLIMCDIDFFKFYNDTYGHMNGDECLKKVANALNETIKRPGDLVSRYGGEEFAVVLPETDEKGALAVAEILRIDVESLKIEHINSSSSKYVTISLGVATAIPNMDSSLIELIIAADKALYQAKKEGRNRVCIT